MRWTYKITSCFIRNMFFNKTAAVLNKCTAELSNNRAEPSCHRLLLFVSASLSSFYPLSTVGSSSHILSLCETHTLQFPVCHTVTSWISQQVLLSHHHSSDWFQLTMNPGCHEVTKVNWIWESDFKAHFQYCEYYLQQNTCKNCNLLHHHLQGYSMLMWSFLMNDLFNRPYMETIHVRLDTQLPNCVFGYCSWQARLFQYCAVASKKKEQKKRITTFNITSLYSAFFCAVLGSWSEHFILG